MSYTVVESSEDQIEKIYQKHLKWPRIAKVEYVEGESGGNVECWSLHGNKMVFQMRNGIPMFFSFISGGVRYDIHYPKGKIHDRLMELGKKAADEFWKGSQI